MLTLIALHAFFWFCFRSGILKVGITLLENYQLMEEGRADHVILFIFFFKF
jgi:hypothetical protein